MKDTDLRETAATYVATRPVPTGRVSFAKFLDWADEDTWAEWVDGEVTVLTPASFSHQNIVTFLDRVMGIFARRHHVGLVLVAPFLVHLPEHLRRGREPDVIFVREEQLPRFKETHFEGSPDVIVEIVSSESLNRDQKVKYAEYEAAGVREYWLIYPDRAEFFRLGSDRRYHPVRPDEQGIFHSEAFPGFWLKPDWLWQDPLPDEIEVLGELGVI